MPRVSKFTKEQKLEIALEFLSGKLSRGEVGRKHGISATCASTLKDGALAFCSALYALGFSYVARLRHSRT